MSGVTKCNHEPLILSLSWFDELTMSDFVPLILSLSKDRISHDFRSS